MKKYAAALFASTALSFTIGTASAADFPASGVLQSAPPSLFAPPHHVWSGIYVGFNAGGAFGKFSATGSAGGLTADLGSVNASGVIGGAQVGAQTQYEHFVLGVEADFQGSSQDHTDNFNVLGVPVSESEKMPWFATVRGRLGYAMDNVLLYGTGGMAIVDGKISASALGVTASRESSHIGWTAGAGVEWAFAPRWSAKVEYLYMDSGNIGITNVGGVEIDGRIKDNIIRAGVNYQIF